MPLSAASPALTASSAPLKPCSICNGESCIVIPSISSQQHLCLLHYYTTGAHRSGRPPNSSATSATSLASKKKSSSLLVESQRMERQLPKVQEIFAEAFTQLQKDIGEESARAFRSASAADDPLGMLLSSTAPSASRSAIPRSKSRQNTGSSKASASRNNRSRDDLEGGFIREAALPEKLRKLHNPTQLDGFASKYNGDSAAAQRKRPAPRSNTAASAAVSASSKPRNPYQRKHNPPSNIWNQILDSKYGNGDTSERKKMKFEDIEKQMVDNITSGSAASTVTCACGSTNVEISGNVTRNNDMMKGEVWGAKNRAETVVERCHCRSCGKQWNED